MIPGSYTGLPCWPIRDISTKVSLSVRLFFSMRAFLSDGISTITGVGTTGAAIGTTDSWSSITTGSSPGVPPLSTAGLEYMALIFGVLRDMVFRIAARAFAADRLTTAPIAGSSRRTWNPVNAPAHSADSTTAAWQTSTPSAASPASAEVCMAEASPAGHPAVSVAVRTAAAEATGKRICGGKQFLSKKTGMEVSKIMRIKDGSQKIPWKTVLKFTPVAVFALWSLAFTWILLAEPPTRRTFASPAQASRALFLAARAGDATALLKIFGPDGKEIVSSGDPVEDKNSREQFVRKYREMNRLVEEPDGTVRLYIGAENWPLPIPLVNHNDAWYFDTAAGKEEILLRRIGQNEMAAMRICQELVDAQKEYYAESLNGEVEQYAQKFVSDEGKHNGLYWKTGRGESESPVGPHLAYAGGDTYLADSKSGAQPFYGYYFQILTKQGEHAAGGAKSYIVDGKMTGGFAFLAYPVEYAASGVMSFIVGQDGIVYQKDLGPKTAELAKTLREYNPDKTWARVD